MISDNVEFLEEQFCVYKIFKMSAIFKMATKTLHKKWVVKIQLLAAILKMATGRNFSMSGINSGHPYLPTNQIWMTSDNVEFLPPIFYTMFWVVILKMADILAFRSFRLWKTIDKFEQGCCYL
jgi:hypothetical protein